MGASLINLTDLDLGYNQLTGPILEMNALTNLTDLDLGANQLTSTIPDMSALINLTDLDLGYNQLTGPIPDMSVLSNLKRPWVLDLRGNLLCLPEGTKLSRLNNVVTAHLQSLNLPVCTDAELAAPGVPQS